MPVFEPCVIEGHSYTLRHVGPQSTIWPNPPVAVTPYVVLNQPSMVCRSLPMANVPNSTDFATGTWTARMNDSGEFSITFPNKEASDGESWRNRFDPFGKNEWLEIAVDGHIESLCCIEKIDYKRDQIVVSGHDSWWQLKNAYERDWIVVQGPRDVCERATYVWQGVTSDDFSYDASSPNPSIPGAQWTTLSVLETGVTNPGLSAVDGSWPGGSLTWNNPTGPEFGGSQDAYAFTNSGSLLETEGLQCTQYGFSVPGTATITGIQATMQTAAVASPGGTWSGIGPYLVIGGAVNTGYYASISPDLMFPSGSVGTQVFGGPTDLWHTGGLTPAQVNASGFGLEVAAQLGVTTGTVDVYVYAAQLTIFYTLPGAGISIQPTGGLAMSVNSTVGNQAAIISQPVPLASPSAIWAAETTVLNLPGSGANFSFIIWENGQPAVEIFLANDVAFFYQIVGSAPTYGATSYPTGAAALIGSVTVSSATSFALRIESDGEWLAGYINGQLIDGCRRHTTVPGTLSTHLALTSAGTAANITITNVLTESLQPFALRTSNQRYSDAGAASAGADISGGGTAWTNPGNVAVANAKATNTISTTLTATQDLAITGFGFNVPAAATITGVELWITRDNGGSTSVQDNVVQLTLNGTSGSGNNLAVVANQPAESAATQAVFGGLLSCVSGAGPSTSYWGVALTPAQVNASTFGVLYSQYNSSSSFSAVVSVYCPVVMIVYYTVPGIDNGDYALPSITSYAVGTVSTYPWGGLHGRYFNNADLASDVNVLVKLHHPKRTAAYTGSTGNIGEYANQLDPTINITNGSGGGNPPGAAGQYWSTLWFGSIYLKYSAAGNYNFSFTADDGVRVYIGKTRWGEQLIDAWQTESATTYSVNVACGTSGPLAGTNPDGTPNARDGWYPIVIEYFQGGGGNESVFKFTPPVSYTDPGGTSLVGGTQVVVPATSLSPLGCVDQRHQGISHFDLLQKNGQAFGYQLSNQPKSLESGYFPGVLAPRFQVGTLFDAVLEPDDHPRTEGLLNYSNTLDATDSVTSLWGNGAGFQNGNTGQLQAYVFDHTSVDNALFNIQGWQDFSDSAFAALLEGQLTSELGLRLQPWQVIAGDPMGRERLAFTWPLSGKLAQMRWVPGDGMRVWARDVNIQDLEPRQLLLVTRSIHPNGSTGVQVGFAERPRSGAHALKKAFFQASRWQRNYQRQSGWITGTYVWSATAAAGVGNGTTYSVTSLAAGDTVVAAQLRVTVLAGTSPSFGIEINGVDRTAALNGPWGQVPLILDITPYAMPTSGAVDSGRIFIRLLNESANAITQVDFQPIFEVIR